MVGVIPGLTRNLFVLGINKKNIGKIPGCGV